MKRMEMNWTIDGDEMIVLLLHIIIIVILFYLSLESVAVESFYIKS